MISTDIMPEHSYFSVIKVSTFLCCITKITKERGTSNTTMQSNIAVTPIKSKLISDESISTNGSNKSDKDKPTTSTLSSSNRKRMVDETLLTPAETENLLERRAYNRECATRARKRVKQNISQLEKQVKELQDDKVELRRSLATMEKQVLSLTQEKRELLMKVQVMATGSGSHMIYNNSIGVLSSAPSSPPPQLLQLQQLQQHRQLNSLRGFY